MVTDSTEYEVLAVRYGTRQASTREIYLNFDLYGEDAAPIGMDYYFWVLRNAERTVLVDCGFNAGSGERRGRTMLRAPLDALRDLGIAPEEVTDLVVTHAHYDHAGNVAALPEARVVIARREFEFWTGPLAEKKLFAHSAEVDDIRALREVDREGRLLQLDAGTPSPIPGVALRQVGGHTPGQLVVLVEAERGPVLLASDAMHYYSEVELDRPFTHVIDVAGMYRGFDVLREMEAGGAALVAGHDPRVMQMFPDHEAAPGLAVRLG